MNSKVTYRDKLRDPRWQKKRLKIFERDEWTCQTCNDKENNLQVHHKEYINGKDPWDYEDEYLITLCEQCHQRISPTKNNKQKELSHKHPSEKYVDNLICMLIQNPKLATGFSLSSDLLDLKTTSIELLEIARLFFCNNPCSSVHILGHLLGQAHGVLFAKLLYKTLFSANLYETDQIDFNNNVAALERARVGEMIEEELKKSTPDQSKVVDLIGRYALLGDSYYADK